MSKFNSQIKYVEARPRKERKGAKAATSIVVAGSVSGEGGVSKSYVDSNFVTLATEQTINGPKDFVGGLKVNGAPITYNVEKKCWQFDGDLVVTGGVAWFSSLNKFEPFSIMDSILVDGETIGFNANKQLKVIGGGGGGTGGGLTIADLESYLTTNKYTTSSVVDKIVAEALAGYVTVSDLSSTLSSYQPMISEAAKLPYSYISGVPTALSQFTDDVVAGNYLPKSGGTIDTARFYGIVVNSLDDSVVRSASVYSYKGEYMTQIGWDNYDGRGSYIYNYLSCKYLGIKDDGTPYFDNSILIHSSNIGDYKAGSAYSADSAYSAGKMSYSNEYHVRDSLQYLELFGQNDYGDTPTNDYYFILKMGHGDADDYFNRTLAFSFWNNNIYTRSKRDGVGYEWQQIAFTNTDTLSPSSGTLSINSVVAASVFRGSFRGQLLPSIPDLDCNNAGSSHGWVNPASGFTNTPFAGELVSFDAGEGLNALQFLSRYDVAELYVRHRLHINNNWSQWLEVATINAPSLSPSGGLLTINGSITAKGVKAGFLDIQEESTDWIISSYLSQGIGRVYCYNGLTNSYGDLWIGQNSGNALVVKNNGSVVIGGTTADAKLHVYGDILATGAITTPSITIGGLPISKLQDDTLYIDSHLVVRGTVSWFGVATTEAMASIEQRVLALEQQVEQLSA